MFLNVLILKMYEIKTLLLLQLKIYLIILKHIKSLILLKKLVSLLVGTDKYHIQVSHHPRVGKNALNHGLPLGS